MLRLLKILFRLNFWITKKETGVDKLEEHYFDKKCNRCGTVRKVGVDHCPVCTGLTQGQLIDLHIKQRDEKDKTSKMGVWFTLTFIVMVALMYWFIA